MASLNRVFLIGNLTRDPELRYTPEGTAVLDLGLAVSRVYTTKDNEKKTEVCFVDVVVWRRQAETCHEYLSKGSPIFVEGRLQFDQWETSDGEKRSKLRVIANRVQFLGRPKEAKEVTLPEETKEPVEPRAAETEDIGEDDIPF